MDVNVGPSSCGVSSWGWSSGSSWIVECTSLERIFGESGIALAGAGEVGEDGLLEGSKAAANEWEKDELDDPTLGEAVFLSVEAEVGVVSFGEALGRSDCVRWTGGFVWLGRGVFVRLLLDEKLEYGEDRDVFKLLLWVGVE